MVGLPELFEISGIVVPSENVVGVLELVVISGVVII